MTHGGFEISVVRPDPAEFWQQLWQVSHFVHQEKELARWELLLSLFSLFYFSPKTIAFLPAKQLFFSTCRKLSANTFLGSAAPEGHGS